jgi:hypothetical protein
MYKAGGNITRTANLRSPLSFQHSPLLEDRWSCDEAMLNMFGDNIDFISCVLGTIIKKKKRGTICLLD